MDLPHNRTPRRSRRPLSDVMISRHIKVRRHETPLIRKIAIKHITKAQEAFPVRPRIQHHRHHHHRHHRDKQLNTTINITTRRFDNQLQFDRAVHIYTQLRAIPDLTSLVPRLHGQDRNRLEIELQYPTYGLVSIYDRARGYGDRTAPLLRMRHVCRFKDALLNDIAILGDSKIACDVDLSSLHVVYQGHRFLPFLDNFSLEIVAEDENHTQWTDLKVSMVQNIKAQLDVLERLAQLTASSRRQLQVFETDLDPELVIKMLQLFEPPSYQQNHIICHVNRYIPDLGQYVADHVMRYLYSLEPRDHLPEESQQEETNSYLEAVRHVLQLSRGNCHQEASLLFVQVSLLIIHAVLLNQLHAKVIKDSGSKNILQWDGPGVAEAYMSDENFHKVSEAHNEVVEAVKSLEDTGRMPNTNVHWFFGNSRFSRRVL
ncbi:hypothetical protein F4813DRAFT_386061 [Daldinia decipiens]|uniref:uncharacterized protein n=1 Tax=Daldinia decipiens TaxID=326647 RepID=UPI0020C48BAA|nr:uncharacterized protein F4813DRAFT_386061 [Daldinia decipiens]KAI1661531.1 hypothetical protein F4813DRAFT_386061 [Daldinia decipiens]